MFFGVGECLQFVPNGHTHPCPLIRTLSCKSMSTNPITIVQIHVHYSEQSRTNTCPLIRPQSYTYMSIIPNTVVQIRVRVSFRQTPSTIHNVVLLSPSIHVSPFTNTPRPLAKLMHNYFMCTCVNIC